MLKYGTLAIYCVVFFAENSVALVRRIPSISRVTYYSLDSAPVLISSMPAGCKKGLSTPIFHRLLKTSNSPNASPTAESPITCHSTDDGAFDVDGLSCAYYDFDPSECSYIWGDDEILLLCSSIL